MNIHDMLYIDKSINDQYIKQINVPCTVIKHFNFFEMCPPVHTEVLACAARIENVWVNKYINVVIMVLAKYKKAELFVEFMSSYGSVLFLHKHLSETYGKKFDTLPDAKQYISDLIMDESFLMQFKPPTTEILYNGDHIVWKDAIIGLNIDPKKLFIEENKNAVEPVSRDT